MIVSSDHVFLAAKNRLNPDWVKVSELSKKDFSDEFLFLYD
jgi:hypothetical protein